MRTTPAYRIEFRVSGACHTPAAWRVSGYGQLPGYGKPTAANLTKYMDQFGASLRPGGANAHLGTDAMPYFAQIVRQADGLVMATWSRQDWR